MRRLAIAVGLCLAALAIGRWLFAGPPPPAAPASPVAPVPQAPPATPPPTTAAAAEVSAAPVPDLVPDLSFSGHCPRSSGALWAAAHDLLAPLQDEVSRDPRAREAVRRALASPPPAGLPALREARSYAPRDRALALATALALLAAFDLHEADAVLGELLRAHPSDALAGPLRAHLRARIEHLGPPRRVERSGISLRWFGEALGEEQARRLAEAVDALREEASRAAGAPIRPELEVLVYPDLAALQAATCAAPWMGGAFDGARMHLVRTGDPLGVDLRALRHETMHVEIRQLVPEVPAWLNEGLAEHFSSPSPAAHLRRWRDLMVRNRTCIPFSSLLSSLQDFESADANLAYAQSVAMVEFLIARGGPEAPRRALRYLAAGGDRAQVLAQALGRTQVTEDDFLDYLASSPSP